MKVNAMQISSDIVHTAPHDAATVIILRNGPQGLEVFLVQRHSCSEVLGGAYVFPGGKRDDSDSQLEAALHLDVTAQQLHAQLAEPDLPIAQAKALYVAALREAFEECGVLFAQDLQATAIQTIAAQLQQGRMFNLAVAGHGLRLHTQSLLPWSRWITPRMPSFTSKRFDTRFFVAALPHGQTARHDGVETTHSIWLTPHAALQRYWAREMELAPPQIMTLAHLARHHTVASALQSARQGPPPLVLPEPFDDQGERVLTYPGDPWHSVQQRAMPGPTRLHYRNQRFEPAQGFAALFA
ncbi:MAG: NUDIX hydrolase [Rhodoferax sp.]|nr:NUDIX hydrolase [Rhodoferax sp.]